MAQSPEQAEPIFIVPVAVKDLPPKAEIFHADVPTKDISDLDRIVYMRVQPIPTPADQISALAGISMFDRSPHVEIVWGGERGQLDPQAAQELGLSILQAAAFAYMESLVIRGLEANGFAPQAAVAALGMVREQRALDRMRAQSQEQTGQQE